MDKWKEIKIDGIAEIEKYVAEFRIWEFNYTPYAKFKVKIYKNTKGKYTGITNLQVIDQVGSYYSSVGFGDTIESALEDTLRYFFSMLEWKKEWNEEDFECMDPYDF